MCIHEFRKWYILLDVHHMLNMNDVRPKMVLLDVHDVPMAAHHSYKHGYITIVLLLLE